MPITHLNNIAFEAYSPSAFSMVGTDVKLVFDGQKWWLFDDKEACSFASRSEAVEWLGTRLAQLSWPTSG